MEELPLWAQGKGAEVPGEGVAYAGRLSQEELVRRTETAEQLDPISVVCVLVAQRCFGYNTLVLFTQLLGIPLHLA